MIPVYYWLPALGCLSMGFMFLNVSAVAEQFMHLFELNYAGLGFFLSALFWAHALVQVPAGLIVDRLGTLRALTLSCLLCAAAGFVPLLAPHNLYLAVAMRLLIGLATGLLFLSVVSAVKALCPPAFLNRAQGIQGAAFSLGTMAPFLALPPFGKWGWAAAYGLGGALPVLVLAALLFVPWAPLRRETAPEPANAPGLWAVLRRVACNRRIWFIACCHGFSFGTITALGNWLAVMLADCSAKGGTPSAAEAWALPTSLVLLAGTAARVLGGELGRVLPKPRLMQGLMLGIGLSYLLLAVAGNVWLLLAFAFVLALCCGGTYASVFTMTIEAAGPSHVATGIGFMSMLANFVNVGLILLLGVVRQYAGGFFPALTATGVCALALVVWGHFLAKDGAWKNA